MKNFATRFVLSLVVVVALVFAFSRCVLPDDVDRTAEATEAYKAKVEREITEYNLGHQNLEQFQAAVAKARDELKSDMTAIKEDIVARTKSIGTGLAGGTDPLSLGLTAVTSILVSIFGTSAIRNKSRQAEIRRLDESIAETDRDVARVEGTVNAKVSQPGA